MNTLRGVPLVRGEFQLVVYMDSLDHENVAVLLDFTHRVGGQVGLDGRNAARLKGAAEGAGQSPGGRGHHVIERRGVRGLRVRVRAVVCRDL